MSQFDFPRINFFGKTSINIATCNNDDFKPAYTANGSGIMVHDIVNTTAYLPPRIYVTADTAAKVPHYDYVDAGQSNGTDYKYVVIEPVGEPLVFVEWSQKPLGTSDIDKKYWPLYLAAQLMSVDPKKPVSTIPAEWNYNGGMQNVIHDCTVVSVATMPTDNTGKNLYLASNPGNCPSDLAVFLGASFDATNDGGAPTAVLCDMNPACPYTTQYFTQGLYLRQSGSNATTLMAGAPLKGVTRWINFGRVVNIPGSPMVASGGVFQAIPTEAMTHWSQLEAVFQKYGDPSRTLIGAFVRYDLFEVYECRHPDYSTMDQFATNPAYMSVMGSITPWYEGEMGTGSMGRLLNPTPYDGNPADNPYVVTPAGVQLAPITFKVDTTNNLLSLDLFNTLPENRTPSNFSSYPNGNTPPAMSYELADLGKLSVNVAGTTLAAINVTGNGSTGLDRQALINNGGMYDFVFPSNPNSSIYASSTFSIGGTNTAGNNVTLMEESWLVVQSDQSVAYANQGGPNDSFMSQGNRPGPVTLRVLAYGQPIPQSAPLNVTQTKFGLDCIFNLLQLDQQVVSVYDGATVTMDTSEPNLLLYTYSLVGDTAPTAGSFSGATEFYLNLRVLPDQTEAYAPYYNGQKTLDWDALYNEIFHSYSMLYPAMTQQLPFEDGAPWSSPFVASRLMQVISPNMWNQPWYMPRTRDLSDAQRLLIDTWAQSIISATT